MKFLFIHSSSHGIDYQPDCLLIGLKEIFGNNVVDVSRRHYLYKDFPQNNLSQLYGKGFTVTRLFDDDTDRTDIEQKIKAKYFDYVIYGSIFRCLDYFELVTNYYSPGRIICIDGEDEPNYHKDLFEKFPYFKREKYDNFTKSFPISFAIPSCKISEPSKKLKDLAHIIPGDKSTYIYLNEASYYDDYKNSRFAITTKKSGWDCMRHYEILANGCIPLFSGLEMCPENTLKIFPKDICIRILAENLVVTGNIKRLSSEFINYKYDDYLLKIFNYTKTYLTTTHLAHRFLGTILQWNQ